MCEAGNTVVADEDELLAAVASAPAGDVIAVDGMSTISTSNVQIATDNVTLTCATPGAGINLQNGRHLETFANGVVVSRLVIDADELRLERDGLDPSAVGRRPRANW